MLYILSAAIKMVMTEIEAFLADSEASDCRMAVGVVVDSVLDFIADLSECVSHSTLLESAESGLTAWVPVEMSVRDDWLSG